MSAERPALFVVHNCIYDAWAAYDRTAVGTMFRRSLRQRATIGGPSLELRTPCNTALFHWMTTFGDCANAEVAQVPRIASATATAIRYRNRGVLGFGISLPHKLGRLHSTSHIEEWTATSEAPPPEELGGLGLTHDG